MVLFSAVVLFPTYKFFYYRDSKQTRKHKTHLLCVIKQQRMLNITAVERTLPPENDFLLVPAEHVASVMSSSTTRHDIPTAEDLLPVSKSKEVTLIWSETSGPVDQFLLT